MQILSSLVAGLLHSYRPTNEGIDMGRLPHLSEYTPNLVALARKVIQVHNDQPNRAQLALPANRILICADPLGAVHQAFALNEREAKGKGAHGGNTINHSKDAKKPPPPVSVGAVEYRKIYNEVWYILGHIASTETGEWSPLSLSQRGKLKFPY